MLFLTKKLFLIILLFQVNFCFAKSGLIKESHLFIFSPPVINKQYFSFEYGFIVDKKAQNYFYNAYVTAALFEDWLNRNDNLKAGALGIKAGIMLPIGPTYPFSIQMGAGYAKTVLHKSPIIGRSEQSQAKKTMYLGEIGLLYKQENFIYKITFQKNNVEYFSRNIFLSIGVDY